MKKRFQKKRPAVRRKRAYQKSKTLVIRNPSIIPDKMIVSLPYVDFQNLGQIIGSGFNNYSRKTYTMNSIYDPEPGAANTTVLGWSEWANFYTRYRVIATKYEITLFNASDDTMVSGCLYFSPYTFTNTTSPGDASHWLTQPRSRKFALGNRSGSKSTVTIKGKISMPSLLGMTNEQYRTSEDTSSLYNDTPNAMIQMAINCLNTNSSVNGGQVQASVKLTYVTELFQRVKIDIPILAPTDIPEPTE